MSADTFTSRADAKLKRLSLPLMAQLVDKLAEPGVTTKQALDWLADQPGGCRSSVGALSEHYSWLVARVSAWRREEAASAFMEAAREQLPGLSETEIFELGQKHFALASIASSDALSWRRVNQIDLAKRQLALDREKFEEAKRRAAQADATEEVAKSDLSPEAKEKRIREIFGLA